MATVSQADQDQVADFLREVRQKARPRLTTRQRESRTATNQYKSRLKARESFETQRRSSELAYAQALGEERAANAALRERSVLQSRSQFRQQQARAAIPGNVARGIGTAALKSGPSQAVFGTMGSIIAAIAIAIILYLLLNNAQNVSGTSNSILSWVTAFTSTDPLFSKSSSSSTSSSSTSSSNSSSTTTGGGGAKTQ